MEIRELKDYATAEKASEHVAEIDISIAGLHTDATFTLYSNNERGFRAEVRAQCLDEDIKIEIHQEFDRYGSNRWDTPYLTYHSNRGRPNATMLQAATIIWASQKAMQLGSLRNALIGIGYTKIDVIAVDTGKTRTINFEGLELGKIKTQAWYEDESNLSPEQRQEL